MNLNKLLNIILIVAIIIIGLFYYATRSNNELVDVGLFQLRENCREKAIEFAEKRSNDTMAYASEWVVLRSDYNQNEGSCFGEFMELVDYKGSCAGHVDYWIFNLLTLEYIDGYTVERRDSKCIVDTSKETIEYLEKVRPIYENTSKEIFGSVRKDFHPIY